MRRVLLMAVLSLGVLLVGCAGSEKVAAGKTLAAAPELAGTYLATSVTGYAQVPLSQISIAFTHDRLTVDGSGCTPMSGPYSLDNGRLEVTLEPGPAAGACDIDTIYLDQDNWLFAFVAAGPEVSVESDRVTLTGSDAVAGAIVMQRSGIGRVALVLGVRWGLDAIVRGGSSTQVPDGVTMSVGLTGLLWVSNECFSVLNSVSVSDTEITMTVESVPPKPCDFESADLQAAVIGTLTGTVSYVVDDHGLTVTGADGTQLNFSRRRALQAAERCCGHHSHRRPFRSRDRLDRCRADEVSTATSPTKIASDRGSGCPTVRMAAGHHCSLHVPAGWFQGPRYQKLFQRS